MSKLSELNSQGMSLLLAGGGARGIIQFGQLKAFLDLGLKHSKLYACSVGALNGALLQQDEFSFLEEIWMTISNSKVFTNTPFTWLNAFGEKASIYDSKPLNNLMGKYLNPDKLIANPVPFTISTTDQKFKENFCLKISELEKNEIQPFIFASASPPVFFPNVKFRGRPLADGGVSNNYLINRAIGDDNKTLVIITPTVPEFRDPRNVMDQLNAVTSMSEFISLRMSIEYVEKINEIIKYVHIAGLSEIKLVLVRPPKSSGVSLLDFNYEQQGFNRKDLIKLGYDSAMNTLKEAFDL